MSTINSLISGVLQIITLKMYQNISFVFETDLAASRYKLEQKKSVLILTDLKSPVAGVAKYLKVNTLNGILRPDNELMQILPTEHGVVIAARVNPTDIGPLQLWLPVFISLDTFNFFNLWWLEWHAYLLKCRHSISYCPAHIRVNEMRRLSIQN